MFQLLKQHAESMGVPDPKFGTASGSGPELILTVDDAIEFLQKLKVGSKTTKRSMPVQ
jgi:hypothetical protein